MIERTSKSKDNKTNVEDPVALINIIAPGIKIIKKVLAIVQQCLSLHVHVV